MDRQNSMTDFIHSLPSPAIVASFEGEIKDVNMLGVNEMKAHSKLEVMNFSVIDLMVDKSKFKPRVDLLFEKNIIQNQKALTKTFDGKLFERTIHATILSWEKELFLFQYFASFVHQYPVDRAQAILSEMRKLLPYLNKAGKELLDQIHHTQLCQLEKNEKDAQVKYVSIQLVKMFPALTNAEMYLCSLVLMGFSSREISHFSGFSPNSIRVNIHRLCRKYEVESREELFALLQSAVGENNRVVTEVSQPSLLVCI
jgi:DNA-binding CsgD family transcriptional regulator